MSGMRASCISDRKNGFVSLRDAHDLGNAGLLPMAGRSKPNRQRPHRKVIVVQESLQADILRGVGSEQIADVFFGGGSGVFQVHAAEYRSPSGA